MDRYDLNESLSGKYEGEFNQSNSGSVLAEIRIDVDPRDENSPVLNKISGDVYDVFRVNQGGQIQEIKNYRESWIVDQPSITWHKGQVRISGDINYYLSGRTPTKIYLAIVWRWGKIVSARCRIIEAGTNHTVFSISKKSNSFRKALFEIDVCDSVNNEPILPSFDTHSNPNRPASLSQRTLDIEKTYFEAGIDVTINPQRTIIDDSASIHATWSQRELHDAMELHFSKIDSDWPNFNLWSILAGKYERQTVAGIMFDLTYPHRQGCAVFRDGFWFNHLVPNPSNDQETAAMRELLYTYVHEIGHAFNFMHSWDKSRPDSLSWMNYDWKYDQRNGGGSFWQNFSLRFDDEELIHMRHGELKAVAMGGDSWGSGGHLESPSVYNEIVNKTKLPLQATIRSKKYFRYLEHVVLELKIHNVSDTPYDIDEIHSTEHGNVTVYLEKPDGTLLEYSPIFSMIVKPTTIRLEPSASSCQNIALSFGKHGHYFDLPGIYKIRMVYHGFGGIPIPSNIYEVKIGNPESSKEDKDGMEFYSKNSGMALYVNGSDSPFLQQGMQVLNRLSKEYTDSSVGAQISLLLAKNLSRPFHRVIDSKRIETRKADPATALDLLKTSVHQHEKDEETFTNLSYHDCRRTEADILNNMGKKDEAKSILKDLVSYLDSKKVKQYVLDEITSYSKAL